MIGGALQKAIYAALTAAPAICDGRVYDNPPETKKRRYPYVTIGDEQALDDGTSCGDGWEVFSDIHVWSRPAAKSKLEVKEIAADLVDRLTADSFAVPGFAVTSQMQTVRSMRDADGITEHAVATIRHLVAPA